ncbi:carcinoembryonic antigen-related cell adhesion molecule 5 isoform X2 [Esox lucius]|uniref:carcinoembryonic antigen-related cell adhesion molecule 5 isoform X2 n=1 Tax=Esox lucius TaxID=8010 RepID=UPI0014776FBD|nr:carcinoembryonic antigen-related cell adhesion molecule 5 isoform X2 [Esox lucius]
MPNQMKLFILLCSAKAVFSKTEILSHKFGDNVVLKPDSRTNPPSSILWRLGQNKVADFDTDFGPDVTYYGDFNGRTTLDKTTGELTITGLRKTDEGVYSVEFNSKRLEKTYTLSVLKPVPKPAIIVSCNDNKTSCTLTCNGDTAGAEPVTYWWKVGERNWENISKLLTVSKNDSKLHQNDYKYTCKLKNGVSEEDSAPEGQLFDPKPVPKPTIIVSCNDNKISCTLTCNGDTAGAEPVTYWWKVGEGNWEGIGKLLTVAKSDSKLHQKGYKYTCKLNNSVSEKVSDPIGPLFDPKPVPKPTIIVSCNDNKISCTLTCDGDTADAEPVTYWWKVGEGNWEGIGKLLTVARSDSKRHQNGYKYTCKLKNSVSEKDSDPVGQLFGQTSSFVGVGVGVAIPCAAIAILVFVVWRKKTGPPNNTVSRFRKTCGENKEQDNTGRVDQGLGNGENKEQENPSRVEQELVNVAEVNGFNNAEESNEQTKVIFDDKL